MTDKEYNQFLLDMMFLAVSADDFDDGMTEILECLTDPDDEFELTDILFASDIVSIFQRPTSLEQEVLNDYRIIYNVDRFNE